MESQSERSPEGTFEILWFQHNPDDWVAEITDRRSGRKRRVHTMDELVGFVRDRLRGDTISPAES
jgi:hypothetical protein